MSKQNYAVCCYTCEHNGQETCKGCSTILNGENEPYENWELREDLCSKDKKIKDLEDKLTDSEKQIKDARETVNMSVDSWCKNRRKYEAQIAEIQNKSFILYSMLYETLEKQGCDNVASQIDQMTGWTYDKEVNWLKGNRNYDQLEQSQKQLAIEQLEMFGAMLARLVLWDNDIEEWTIGEQEYDSFVEQIDDKIKELKGE